MKPGLLRLMDAHRALDRLLLQHQSALLAQNIPEARRHWTEYEAALGRHMRFEEEEILPIYRRLDPPPKGCPAEFFTGEHKRLREFLMRIKRKISGLGKGKKREEKILKLLDLEWAYKNLMQHHDSREKNVLYPSLDRLVTAAERRGILSLALERKAV